MTARLRGQDCPVCGRLLDAATGVPNPNAVPKVGDVTVCLYCSTVLEFGLGLVLRVCDPPPPPEELAFDLEAVRRIARATMAGGKGRLS